MAWLPYPGFFGILVFEIEATFGDKRFKAFFFDKNKMTSGGVDTRRTKEPSHLRWNAYLMR